MAGLLSAPAILPAPIDAVAAELRLWAETEFAWGRTDCGMSILDYVERVTDRRLRPRPRYTSRIGAGRLLRDAGGYMPLAYRAMAELGCTETAEPWRGDVGLCILPGSGLTACLCLGQLWAARLDHGVVIAPMVAWRSWSVPCPKP